MIWSEGKLSFLSRKREYIFALDDTFCCGLPKRAHGTVFGEAHTLEIVSSQQKRWQWNLTERGCIGIIHNTLHKINVNWLRNHTTSFVWMMSWSRSPPKRPIVRVTNRSCSAVIETVIYERAMVLHICEQCTFISSYFIGRVKMLWGARPFFLFSPQKWSPPVWAGADLSLAFLRVLTSVNRGKKHHSLRAKCFPTGSKLCVSHQSATHN